MIRVCACAHLRKRACWRVFVCASARKCVCACTCMLHIRVRAYTSTRATGMHACTLEDMCLCKCVHLCKLARVQVGLHVRVAWAYVSMCMRNCTSVCACAPMQACVRAGNTSVFPARACLRVCACVPARMCVRALTRACVPATMCVRSCA